MKFLGLGLAVLFSNCYLLIALFEDFSAFHHEIDLLEKADVGEGESLTESVYWATSSDLGPGLYSIHGKLSGFPVPLFSDENLPVVAVQVVG